MLGDNNIKILSYRFSTRHKFICFCKQQKWKNIANMQKYKTKQNKID